MTRGRMMVLAIPALLSTPPLLHAQENGLTGVSKTSVLVVLETLGQTPNGISEDRLRTLLELRLRQGGLRVLSDEEDAADPEINPYVFLNVGTMASTTISGQLVGYAYVIRLSVRVFTKNPFNAGLAPIELWAEFNMGLTNTSDVQRNIERVAVEMIESLLNDWLKANPKR